MQRFGRWRHHWTILQARNYLQMLQSIPIAGASDQTLNQAGIEEAFRAAFSPYRCVVEFQDGGSKVALHVIGRNNQNFTVVAKRVDSLRDPAALAQYIRDIQYHLPQRKLNLAFSVSGGGSAPVAETGKPTQATFNTKRTRTALPYFSGA